MARMSPSLTCTVASGQSYSIAGRSLTRANAAEITNKIEYWNMKVNNLTRSNLGRSRTRYLVGY